MKDERNFWQKLEDKQWPYWLMAGSVVVVYVSQWLGGN